MCGWNPRNCALHDKHQGPCLSAVQLNALVKRGAAELEKLDEATKTENT